MKNVDEAAKQINDKFVALKKEIAESVEKGASKTDLQNAVNKISALEEKLNRADKVNESIDAMTQEIAELKDGVSNPRLDNMTKQINDFISDNIDKIRSIHKAGTGTISLDVKAPTTVMTTNASNPDGIPELVGTQIAPATNIALRSDSIESLTNVMATDLASYPYTESVPKDGDYAAVAEGALKPGIDFTIETRYASPKKIAAHIVLTDESVKDIRGMQDIARNYLFAKHNRKKAKDLINGDGLGTNIAGVLSFADTFNALTLANTISNPNIMDVVNAIKTRIFLTHDYEDQLGYVANLALISPEDFLIHFQSAKDEDGRYLFPQASFGGELSFNGITVRQSEDIEKGKIFVGDITKYNTTNYVPYHVKIGYNNDDLLRNQFTMVGESRLHAFVKRLDQKAFIYDDIETVKAALAAPTV